MESRFRENRILHFADQMISMHIAYWNLIISHCMCTLRRDDISVYATALGTSKPLQFTSIWQFYWFRLFHLSLTHLHSLSHQVHGVHLIAPPAVDHWPAILWLIVFGLLSSFVQIFNQHQNGMKKGSKSKWNTGHQKCLYGFFSNRQVGSKSI